MLFPIKYIDQNMVKNAKDEWYAYYRFEPYNYSFKSYEERLQYFYKFTQLISQVNKGNVHLLQLSVEESMRKSQERSKEYPVGKLSDIANEQIDYQSYVLIDGELLAEPENENDTPFWVGETQLEYRFYIGFRLVPYDDNNAKGCLRYLKDLVPYYKDLILGINNNFIGDYVTISREEYERYLRIENLTYSRISNLFSLQRVTPNEIGYIIEHLYGLRGKSYEEYNYHYKSVDNGDKRQAKVYDLIKLNNIQIHEYPKYLVYTSDEQQTYCAYLSYSELLGENEVVGNEIIYYQQSRFNFPVDTSIKLEIIENKKALNDLKNKKKTLKDMDNHAYSTGNDGGVQLAEALEDVDELEGYLKESKDVMYDMSYLIRVVAPTKELLDEYVTSVRDFYGEYNIKLVCPSGDMFNFHTEFLPSAPKFNKIKNKMCSDFFAGLGFGGSQDIGDKDGIAVGYVLSSGRFFYLKPWVAAQGGIDVKTNSLSAAFVGSLGWGKSFNNKLLLYYSVLYGAKAVMIDPKCECGDFKKMLPEIADEINIVNLTSSKANRGLLDPFVIMQNVEDAEDLALDVLTYLMGISIRDSLRYPALRRAIKAVSAREQRGLLLVIDELRKENTEVSRSLAEHIDGFTDLGLAQLLFSDGVIKSTLSFDKQLNIIQIADLILPEKSKSVEEYTVTEMLSVAMMIVVCTFCRDFIHSDSDTFKITNIDEAWSILNITQGQVLSNKLVREGRSMQAGVWFITQNARDIDDTIRNNLGMLFVFHSEDDTEITEALKLLGLNSDDEGNRKMIASLGHGECVMKDIYGRINVVKFEYILPHLKEAFRTTPRNANEEKVRK